MSELTEKIKDYTTNANIKRPLLMDKLSEFLAVEKGGIKLYELAIQQVRDSDVLSRFRDVLSEHGYDRPRLKVLPRLLLGEEANRTCGYSSSDRVTAEMLDGYDTSQLICQHSRVVTDRGIAVCPILIDSPDAILGQTLNDATRGFAITHGACATCYQFGAICTNPSAASGRGV